MKPYYRTLTNPKYLRQKIRPEDALPVLKTNAECVNEVLEILNAKGKVYYVYFLDGDFWGKREAWKNNEFLLKFDFETPYDFFEILKYKDCIFQWVDEFILISPYDISSKIDTVLESKSFTMTKLKYRSNQMTLQTIAILSHLVREKKKIGRSVWYFITNEEMEAFISGNQQADRKCV